MDFSDEMIDEIFKIFQVESEEIISKLNNSLLELEKRPNNKDAILMMFRDAHTLKGASRMVGFDSVQAIAHKMEDVLGLAKENEIALNSKIIDVLYKTVDFLSELIQKSLNKGQEIYNEDIAKQIALLENVTSEADSVSAQDDQSDFNPQLLAQNIDAINNLISESLLELMNIESKKNPNSIPELLSIITTLYAFFQEIGPYDLKKWFEDIKVKLEFITRASNNLTLDETGDIHQTLDNIINKLISICEIYNLPLIDYYSLAFDKMATNKPKNLSMELQSAAEKPINPEIITEESTETEVEKFDFEFTDKNEFTEIGRPSDFSVLQEKIDALASGASIKEIKDLLIETENASSDENVKNIVQKIILILDYAQENEIKLDEDTIAVLKQSIEYCEADNRNDIADKELILQRLEITRQMLELNYQGENNQDFSVKNKYKIKNKKLSNFSEIFNTGEIKTLRVDSAKLDTLVSQVNELTITKIRTKKHLHKLNIINNELEEWQKSSIKVLNYLKYYDKKYFQSSVGDNPVSFFVKQLLGIFTENNKKVQEAVSNISSLHRTIQEDDTKMKLVVENMETMVKNIRVLPLATVFHLFGRMVRDIAQEKNKKIELEIIGSETSTDKKIIEEIKAPLIHIIRNSIDHGIETPEERIAMGKNPVGKIILSARQVNNKVIIQIEDDGKGINIEKVKDKALRKGYLTQEEIDSMSEEQLTNIIFTPGFSTGDEITNISGRGIGMDVVQTKISQLNGKVKVISELNKGCCVQIELPTTMSTMQAFLVESANQTYAIEMEVINTVLRKNCDEIILNKGKKSIIFNEKTIPLFNLSDILKLPTSDTNKSKETILILQSDNKMMALAVDKLIGDQEILNKKLCAPLYKLKNISGITTLASGETCLILNSTDILNATNTNLIQKAETLIEESPKNNTYKILLVDDSITTRTLEKNILEKAGYNIEIAENPFEAFEKMKHTRFNLIISDMEMPEMNGLEFLEKIKTDEMYSEIPFIMVSSLIDEDCKKRAMDLGAKKYIIKGEFNQDSFQETIKEILRNEL